MDEQQVIQLLEKYNRAEATADEVKLLENWYLATGRSQRLSTREESFGNLKNEIWTGTLKMAGLEEEPVCYIKGRIRYRYWALGMAAAIALLVFGIWFFNATHVRSEQNELSYINDVAPGKNMATLTLANGHIVQLSEKKKALIIDASGLKYNDGSRVPEDGKLGKDEDVLVASTPRGGIYQIILPDKTKVWLNAASSLKFPSQFSGKERRVILDGEAYFEVQKLTAIVAGKGESEPIPFLVESRGQTIQVLGTHFNVNAYPDENSVKTTLLEGAVRVTKNVVGGRRNVKDAAVVLKPGQQSVINENHKITVNTVDVEEFVAWQKGNFIFNGENMTSIMKKLEKWYDVEVQYEGKVTEEPYYGNISRFKNISQVLKMLESAGGVRFEIKGKKVVVKKDK